MIVPSEPSTGSPTLLRIISNVPTSNTAIQITCTIIINQLKIRNGRISAQYTDFLKNGIFFNIIRSVGDICTFESEHDHGRNDKDYVCNNFHNDVSEINRIKKKGSFSGPGCNMDRRSAPVGALWLVNQVLEEFFAYAAGKCQSKKRGLLAEPQHNVSRLSHCYIE